MQTKEELESWWEKEDAWGYETNPDDAFRKQVIITHIDEIGSFDRALDIGGGEGFITRDLPAKEIHMIEMSDNAATRLPGHVERVYAPQGTYDLVVATGVLYKQYDYKLIWDWIEKAASKYIITCNIKDWELPYRKAKQILEKEFPYREYTQKLRIYEVTS